MDTALSFFNDHILFGTCSPRTNQPKEETPAEPIEEAPAEEPAEEAEPVAPAETEQEEEVPAEPVEEEPTETEPEEEAPAEEPQQMELYLYEATKTTNYDPEEYFNSTLKFLFVCEEPLDDEWADLQAPDGSYTVKTECMEFPCTSLEEADAKIKQYFPTAIEIPASMACYALPIDYNLHLTYYVD